MAYGEYPNEVTKQYEHPFKTEVVVRGNLDNSSFLANIGIKNSNGEFKLFFGTGETISKSLSELAKALRKKTF